MRLVRVVGASGDELIELLAQCLQCDDCAHIMQESGEEHFFAVVTNLAANQLGRRTYRCGMLPWALGVKIILRRHAAK